MTLTMQVTEDVKKGQAIYSKPVLALYDLWVLGISNQFFWKCPTSRMLTQFDALVTDNHLDVGVGTGYYLDKCRFPSQSPRLALMDLNPNSLAVTAGRVARYQPITLQHNVLEPIPETHAAANLEPFDSISVNYLFHCLPGKFSEKLRVLENLDPLLKTNGRIFGATILHDDVPRNWAASRLMALYNKKGIFSNTEDRLEDLELFLAAKYAHFGVQVEGCVALFWAMK